MWSAKPNTKLGHESPVYVGNTRDGIGEGSCVLALQNQCTKVSVIKQESSESINLRPQIPETNNSFTNILMDYLTKSTGSLIPFKHMHRNYPLVLYHLVG